MMDLVVSLLLRLIQRMIYPRLTCLAMVALFSLTAFATRLRLGAEMPLAMPWTPKSFVQEYSLVREWIFDRRWDERVEWKKHGRWLRNGPVKVELTKDRFAKFVGTSGGSEGEGVWQYKRRISSGPVEVEVEDDPNAPNKMLLYVTEARTGLFNPHAVRFDEGKIYLILPPFLPWNKRQVGTFTVKAKSQIPLLDKSMR